MMDYALAGLDAAALVKISAWFARYAAGFRSSDRVVDENIRLKIEHTRRVREEAVALAAEENMPEDFGRLLQAAAWLHDVGRFEQFSHYRTFDDASSEDHAVLGWRILHDGDALNAVPEPPRTWLLEAVRLHSRAELPVIEDATLRQLCELLRDADKLDIWRMVLADYARPGGAPDKPFYRGLPREPGVSPEVLAAVAAQQPISFRHVKTLNDFLVLQAAMIFDLNSRAALARVRERGVLPGLRLALASHDTALNDVFAAMTDFVNSPSSLAPAGLGTGR